MFQSLPDLPNKIIKGTDADLRKFSINEARALLIRVSHLLLNLPGYSGDLNTDDHLNTRNIWIPETFEYGFQMVDLWVVSYVLDPPFKYQISISEKKMASICPVFKWLGCLVFKWHSKTRPFGIQPLFDHSNTRRVRYSDPHCILSQSQYHVWHA